MNGFQEAMRHFIVSGAAALARDAFLVRTVRYYAVAAIYGKLRALKDAASDSTTKSTAKAARRHHSIGIILSTSLTGVSIHAT
jgi:hypothetical protein